MYKRQGLISSAYQDVDGERIWTVTMSIGTKGVRSFNVSAKNKAGDISSAVRTNEVVVSKA